MARRRDSAADAAARASAHPPQSIPSGPSVDRNRLLPGHPVRHDGWTQERTQRFFDALGHTGCVRDASRIAGVSNVAAYRLKARYPLFAAEWDKAMERAQQGLIAIAYRRAVEGRETVIIRKGEEVERRIAPSDSMLGLLIKRGDMAGSAQGARDPEAVIDREQWQAGWRFDGFGKKYQDDPDAGRNRLAAKMESIRERLRAHAEAGGLCSACGQPWPRDDPRSMAELVAAGVVDPAELFEGEDEAD